VHKQYCGKTYQEIRAMHPHNKWVRAGKPWSWIVIISQMSHTGSKVVISCFLASLTLGNIYMCRDKIVDWCYWTLWVVINPPTYLTIIIILGMMSGI
jgi:hypothetical protein